MHTVIDNFLSVYAILLLQVGIEARFNVLNNGFPTVTILDTNANRQKKFSVPLFIIYEITEAGCVNNIQAKANAILFNI